MADKISARAFYANYHGHELHRLFSLQSHFRRQQRSIVWFAGDSSLGAWRAMWADGLAHIAADNKHWQYPTDDKMHDPMNDDTYTGPALNGYEQHLSPPRCIRELRFSLL